MVITIQQCVNFTELSSRNGKFYMMYILPQLGKKLVLLDSVIYLKNNTHDKITSFLDFKRKEAKLPASLCLFLFLSVLTIKTPAIAIQKHPRDQCRKTYNLMHLYKIYFA